MRHTTRRLLTGAALVLAAGTGLGMAPGAAYAGGLPATVDVSSTLKTRSAPSTAATIVGTVKDGAKISVACAVNGTTVRGKVRTTKVWDRLTSGAYISHSYVRTSAKIPACPPSAQKPKTPKTPKTVTGTVRTTDGPVNTRSGPFTSYATAGMLANNTVVQLVCSAQGTQVTGTVRTTAQWDRLSDGRYISHAYMLSGTLTACPDAPAPILTPAEFIAAAAPGAQQGWRDYGVPPSVTIAQSILESGWGRSGLSSADKNFFGIKCQNGAYGPHATGCHVYTTTECTKAGKCFQTADAFRTYSTMARSFRDHGHFLKVNKRYTPAFAHTRNADKFIEQIWKAGYATDPKYVAKVTGIMKTYDLYRYDTWK
ncbi:putative glucosaminidase [Actinoplanes missouriensis 431]|uniref:Putative glucosaminidase n=1 Tax=Actinoplanes missouriensis (strain ATCC 14538 / DSM 43046 / CBS 188.64 / JCM 3121 / NBRC 102363 / NCIMB 12654 / NRRL B-3342 / UNCC 431) TaxID=512565 RepID=I0HCD0_ACTM4|nr:sporangiospore maturation cell wall hydrolase GsmA [Actinoplanes missouriensis]BAL90667.1 putative glucosaminidase [Actinoplanes missouriensis 431]